MTRMLSYSLVLVAACAADPSVDQDTQAVTGTWASGLAPDALVGGYDNDAQPLYICNAFFNGNLVPGKIHPGWSGCDFSINNIEYTVSPFWTATPTWVAASTSQPIPSNAAYFGGKDVDGAMLYTCRATVGGISRPGKLRADRAYGCQVASGSFGYSIATYDVLVNMSLFGHGALPVSRTSLGYAPPPSNAIVGAVTYGTTSYLCLAWYNGSYYPGWTGPGNDTCALALSGTAYYVAPYDILLPALSPVSGPLDLSFPTGYDIYNRPWYTCSMAYANGKQVGYVDSTGNCTFGYGGHGETFGAGFNVLAAP